MKTTRQRTICCALSGLLAVGSFAIFQSSNASDDWKSISVVGTAQAKGKAKALSKKQIAKKKKPNRHVAAVKLAVGARRLVK